MIRGFFDFMAKMGLSVRDDPPKIVDLSLYQFGETRNGLALAIRQIPRDDREALASVSVVLRNVGQKTWNCVIPGWLAFYALEVRTAEGTAAPLTPFGRALGKPENQTERINASLAPGALHDTEIPLGSMFRLRKGVRYVVSASCEPAPGLKLESNEIVIG